MAVNDFTGSGFWSAIARWSLGAVPVVADDITINGSATNDQDGTGNSMDIVSSSLTMGTYNILITNNVIVRAVLAMGNSSGSGIECIDFDARSGSTIVDSSDDAKVTCKGNIIFANANIMGGGHALYMVAKATGSARDCDITSPKFENAFTKFLLDDTVTLIPQNTNTYVTSSASTSTEINNEIDTNAKTIYFGCKATGTFTFGANADISGNGSIRLAIADGATVTNNQINPFTLLFNFAISNTNIDLLIPPFEATVANLQIIGSTNTLTRKFCPGEIKTARFTVGAPNTGKLTFDNTNAMDIEIYHDINLTNTGGIGWTNPDGNIIFGYDNATTYDINFVTTDEIDPITVNCNLGSRRLKSDIKTSSITGISGKLIADSAGVRKLIAA
jgi:hypothetical protein